MKMKNVSDKQAANIKALLVAGEITHEVHKLIKEIEVIKDHPKDFEWKKSDLNLDKILEDLYNIKYDLESRKSAYRQNAES